MKEDDAWHESSAMAACSVASTDGRAPPAIVHCDWCGKTYKRDEDSDGESIETAHFGGLQILDCCFEKLENGVLSRIDDIVPWLTKVVAARRDYVKRHEQLLRDLARAINESTPGSA